MSSSILRRFSKRIPGARPLFRAARDGFDRWSFVTAGPHSLSWGQRVSLSRAFHRVNENAKSAHTEGELLMVAARMLDLPASLPGVIVEAGCFQGASTAKLSLVAEQLGRELIVFDSFCGMPSNEEDDARVNAFGEPSAFAEGEFAGSIETVRGNVTNYGRIERCQFIPGWFEDTMPDFHSPVACAYLDVDLPSSTMTCLTYLYPLLSPGGFLFSQDAHLPAVVDVIESPQTWTKPGVPKPRIEYTRHKRLLLIHKI